MVLSTGVTLIWALEKEGRKIFLSAIACKLFSLYASSKVLASQLCNIQRLMEVH